ncbi:MAG: trypsin-like serine protease [Parvibaculum sp.]|uniref:trypsin-like serine peptidase n=1 Tax=Parvibaculum sp. TaxID=2024848 RepID=UPI00271BECA7|nr:trypsin-like serine protease [Parvibaculum sp.]MDO8839286.1 trypsin-like serine protease [Parvibaculum sp.]
MVATNGRGRPKAGAVALGALLLLAAGAADANIFGVDDRRDIRPEDGLSGVGVIVCAGTTRRPTGVLIASSHLPDQRDYDVIVTAAHVFIGPRGRLTDCEFRPQRMDGPGARILYIESGSHTPYRDRDWHNDWAVAVLDRRLDDELDRIEPRVVDEDAAVERRESGARFILAGHNGERGPLQMSENCGPERKFSSHLNRFDPRVVNHDCDMMPGWSGGPLILREDGVNYMIGVNSWASNAITHTSGRAYSGSLNPNVAIRVDGQFKRAIDRLLRAGTTGVTARCLVASRDESPALPC